jgi:hypothetical protein
MWKNVNMIFFIKTKTVILCDINLIHFVMTRTIVTPDKERISLSIPKDYVGIEIEIIAFTREEGLPLLVTSKKKESFDSLSQRFVFSRGERQLLEKALRQESKAVHASSLEVLNEFESIDDEL